MDIHLDHLIPNVFLDRPDIQSDIWCHNIMFQQGNYYLIEAESGSGKSSLCSFLTGYRNDYKGNILLDHENVAQFKCSQWAKVRRNTFSILFQELRLFPELTAYENVLIKNKLTNYKSESQIKNWFKYLGLEDKCNTPIRLMSYGQQQRVALMRSLCQPFTFLIADEPISHLDADNSHLIANLMVEEARKQGAGIIITSIGNHPEIPYHKTFKI